ncbi:CBN-CIT-1.1 protein [Caenorhabditis brenneri]|uniref:CBN-CIT-1.1 protein n=1 Tax=Caenorhabditis brenneri TaxID=135651 RepID=G0N085_CAEBE|nr:CBN-CIT-1.1 protein [Caenorhabditis brenneri]
MKKVDRDETYKNLTTCAYYFATDVMAVTDWSLRYSAHSMSIAIIHLMAAYSNCRTWNSNSSTPTATRVNSITPQNTERTRDARSHSPMVVHHAPDSTMNGAGRPRGYVPKDELTVESSEKRARIEPISTNFVSSSTSSNGKLAPPPIPPQLNFPPPPYNTSVPPPSSSGSGYNIQRNQNQNQNNQNRRPPDNKSLASLSPASFRASARAFDVAPMLTPPVAPKLQSTDSSDMDLEDGEVE